MLFALTTFLQGCSDPRTADPIEVGHDACERCRMTISDGRFGGEIISSKGKVYKFDSFRCLVEFYREAHDPQTGVYFLDFGNPGSLIPRERAALFHFDHPSNPMGSKYIAASSPEAISRMLAEKLGPVITWEEVLNTKFP